MWVKNRILSILRGITIYRRLLLLFFLQTAVILFWCGYMVKNTVADFRESLRFYNSQMLGSVSRNIDQAVRDLSLSTKIPILQTVSGYSQIFRALAERKGQLSYDEAYRINDELNSILAAYDDISTACMVDLDGTAIYATDRRTLYYTAVIPEDSEALSRTFAARGRLILLTPESSSAFSGIDAPENALWGGRAVINSGPYKPLGAVFCCIDRLWITEPFDTGRYYSEQRLGVFDRDGRLVAGEMDPALYETAARSISVEENLEFMANVGGQTAILQCARTGEGYLCVVETPYGLVLSDISSRESGLYLLLIFLVLSIIVITRLLVYSIQTPIHTLKEACDTLEQRDFSVRIEDDARDEMHDLIRSFNAMSEKIHYLIQEVYYRDALLARTELQMLRSQINPHFMYNTLETIRAAALAQNNPELAKMVSLLGKILRYGVSSPSEPVTLAQEIDNLRDYIELQNMHFAGRLQFNVNIEKGMMECEIIKLLLQPLVENAIYHGVGVTDEQGVIDIFGFEEKDRLIFKVADNGVGIDSQELATLNDYINYRNECFKSIGLRNVNRRIKLYYGEEYGLRLDSHQGFGTVITLVVPRVEKRSGKEAEYGSAADR